MNAMIFAAGLGTRLQPLTNKCPKALVEIEGYALLDIALRKMQHLEIQRVIVNVHHHAEQIISFLSNYELADMEILISDERDLLMDTGGGLLKAKHLFIKDLPILIYNVDILTNVNLSKLVDYHKNSNNLVSMFTQNRDASRYLLFDGNDELCGWQNPKTGEEKWSTIPKSITKKGYNGIQMVDYELLSLLKTSGAFPIIPAYIDLAATHKIGCWNDDNAKWFDIGSIAKMDNALNYLKLCSAYEKSLFSDVWQ